MTRPARIKSELAKNFGDQMLPEEPWAGHLPEGVELIAAVAPQTEDQVAALVKICGGGAVRVVPVGGSQQTLGLWPADDVRPVVVLSTAKLNRYLGYSHEDMAIGVQCGVTLAELDELTATFDQHLPIDAPNAEASTVGGLVATNTSGPRGMLHGTIADYVLGAAMVLPDGSQVHSGAKSAKNVAGYDLHKLLVGSYGSLGVITQLQFKLKPIPDDFRIAQVVAQNVSEAEYHVGRLARSQARPAMMALLNSLAADQLGQALGPDQVLMCVGHEGTSQAVSWQMDELQVMMADKARVLDTDQSLDFYRRLVEWPARPFDFSFEAIVLGRRAEALLEYCTKQDIAVLAHAGMGVVLGGGMGAVSGEQAHTIRSHAGPASSVKFIRLPGDTEVRRWNPDAPARPWMRAVKEAFDPKRVFPWPGFLGA